MLDKLEQERIKRLYDRLENMKRNTKQNDINKSNRCSICGDYFYLLPTSNSKCSICFKYLCSKCSIIAPLKLDASKTQTTTSNSVILCRICSEQRELWKKSGAWFLNKFPLKLPLFTSKPSEINVPQTTVITSTNKKPESVVNVSNDNKQTVTQIIWKSKKDSSDSSETDNETENGNNDTFDPKRHRQSLVPSRGIPFYLKSNSSDSSVHTTSANFNSIDDSTNSQPTTPNSPHPNNPTFFNTPVTNKSTNIPKTKVNNKLHRTRTRVLDWCQNPAINIEQLTPQKQQQQHTTTFNRKRFLKPHNELSEF